LNILWLLEAVAVALKDQITMPEVEAVAVDLSLQQQHY
jgi:hypothetical protein